MAQQKKKRSILAMIVTAAAVVSLVVGSLLVRAIWDESTAVHITASEIESSTLVIGTHLIHLSALTDSLYDIAAESGEESGQLDVYYKSELAGGTWFNISSASTLEDITTGGVPVLDSEIEALYFTYHTKSDGVTYDLRTNQAVNIFDIRDPYDLESLDELLPLKIHYDMIREGEGETDVTARIDKIWTTDLSSVEATYAPPMADLQTYLDVLIDNSGESTWIDEVNSVMSSLDASRRYEVFAIIALQLESYLDELNTASESESEDEEEENSTDTDLMSAVAECISNVDTALIEWEGLMLTDGVTVISNTRFDLSESLLADASAPNHAACDVDVQNLVALSNVENNNIVNRTQELELLNNVLIPAATQDFEDILAEGEGAEYRAAKASNASSALLNSLLAQQSSLVDVERNELEFMIQAKTMRIDNDASEEYLDELMSSLGSMSGLIPDDDCALGAQEALSDLLSSLSDMARTFELADGGNEMDQMVAEKEELQAEMMEALDNNDLAGAAELEDAISAIDDAIDALESAAIAEMTSLNDSISEVQAELDAALGTEVGDLEDAIAQTEGEITNLTNSLSDETLDALDEIDRLSGLDDVDTEAISAIQDTISDEDLATLDAIDDLNNLQGQQEGDLATAQSNIDSDLVAELQSTLGELQAALTTVESGLSDGTMGSMAVGLKQDALDLIAQGNLDSSEQAMAVNSISALSNLDASLSFPMLQAVYEAANEKQTLTGDSSLDSTVAAVEAAILNNADAYADSLVSDLTTGDLEGIYGDFADENGLDTGAYGDGNQVLLVALQMYYDETGNEQGLKLLSSQAQNQINLANPLVFERINDSSGEYLPLTAIEALTGRRYIWNESKALGVLALGADYYGFTMYSTEVQRDADGVSSEYMARATKYKNGIHVPEEYSGEMFDALALYLSESSYGVVYNSEIMTLAEALFLEFLA